MAGVITNRGNFLMLRTFLYSGSVELRLFVNDHTPARGDNVLVYEEAIGGGYAPIELRSGLWSLLEGPPATAEYPEQSFSFIGIVGNVYGYYIVDSGENVIGAERFADGPYDIRRNGDRIDLTPVVEQ